MTDKKKQGAVVAVATVLTVTSVLSPVATVYATETDTAIVQQTETEQIKENAPPIELPQELAGFAGQALQEIALPEGWSWTDETTVISKDKMEYPARITVDDETYDYSNVEGFHADGHYVERMVVVTIDSSKSEKLEQAELVQENSRMLNRDTTITLNAGDIEINDINFPDKGFRDWLAMRDYGHDGTIQQYEIFGIRTIDVSHRSDIKDLTGIEYFTALNELYCSGTGITSLDVGTNTALTKLNCSGTGITSLDVGTNTALTNLYCSGTGITSLDVGTNTALTDLDCSGTGITSLDVGTNTALTDLDCSSTGITSLDVGTNTALKRLYCYSTGITSLDVSSNKNLITLNCYDNINLTSLNVSGAEVLNTIFCFGTGIKSLDVSNNTALAHLNCAAAPLIWLNIGNNTNLLEFHKSNSSIDIKITGNTFNIKDIFPTLDLQKVSVTSNGFLDKDKGIVTVDNADKPVIYTYDCGTSKNGAETLNVSLNLNIEKKDSNIVINKDLNKIYDGKPMEKPSVDTTGSTGNVIFTYEVKNSDKWETYSETPTNAGTYRVTAHLQEDGFFKSAQAKREFTISKATNSWIIDLAITGWTFGEQANDPTANAKFGDIINYFYSDSEKGTYTDKVPTTAGTWYVKAVIPETDNYTGMESVKKFEISKAKDIWVEEPAILDWIFGEAANKPTAKAKSGETVIFTYSSSEKGTYTKEVPTTAGTWYMKATVADSNNYTGIESIKKFEITKAKDTWLEEPAILDWVFGEAPNTPTAKSKSGEKVIFTYSSSENGTYTDKVPTTAGTWYMKATVADSNNYTGMESVKKFEITKAKDTWVEEPVIRDWVFGKAPNTPTAKSKSGEVVIFTYSSSENGTYTKDVPTTAGTWYMKATVADSNNYTGIESIKKFEITKAKDTWLEEPAILDWVFGEAANTPTAKAKSGEKVIFTYSSSEKGTYTKDVPTTVGTWYMKATVADSNNYTGMESIKKFKITKAKDTWLEEPAILDWVFGEAASTPTAKAKSGGKVIFTYSSSENGTYTKDVPTTAGTWYMKAAVADSNNYKGLESIISFTITPKSAENNSQIVIPNINSDKDVENLVIKDGDKELIKGTDYDVEKKQDNNKVTVTITFKGNYAGTVIKTYIVEDKKPSVNPDTNKPSDSTKNDKTPAVETGDTATTGIWAMLAALSAGTLALMKGKKRKEKTEE